MRRMVRLSFGEFEYHFDGQPVIGYYASVTEWQRFVSQMLYAGALHHLEFPTEESREYVRTFLKLPPTNFR